ncbi:MAG: ACP phosphodiesterase [Gemmataceae bacterium]
MNLLAHALLAGEDPDAVVGNLIADFIRPADLDSLPPGVRRGVLLHRHIDGFTDRHPVVQRSIARIGGRWGWFSGILIDVYYDHILAAGWDRFHDQPLRAFVDGVHEVLTAQLADVPADAGQILRGFVAADRLASYASADGITDALARLSDRIAARLPKRAVRLEEAVPDLLGSHQELAEDFETFFPAVRPVRRRMAVNGAVVRTVGVPRSRTPDPTPKDGLRPYYMIPPDPFRGHVAGHVVEPELPPELADLPVVLTLVEELVHPGVRWRTC